MNFFLILSTLLSLYSCKVDKKAFIGKYKQDSGMGQMMIFDNNNFVLKMMTHQKDAPPCIYGDTITFGNWKLENSQMISVDNSDLIGSIIDAQFEESIGYTDTISINIDNPIEDFYLRKKANERDIFYEVVITSNDIRYDAKVSGIYKSNFIKFFKPNNIAVNQITIYVIPTHTFEMCNIGERYFYTLDYNIKDKNKNLFKVLMPTLTYGFMSYKRLNRDFIRIIDKNHIEWDGDIYSKQTVVPKS